MKPIGTVFAAIIFIVIAVFIVVNLWPSAQPLIETLQGATHQNIIPNLKP